MKLLVYNIPTIVAELSALNDNTSLKGDFELNWMDPTIKYTLSLPTVSSRFWTDVSS